MTSRTCDARYVYVTRGRRSVSYALEYLLKQYEWDVKRQRRGMLIEERWFHQSETMPQPFTVQPDGTVWIHTQEYRKAR